MMSIQEDIYIELSRLGLEPRDNIRLQEIRNKDGIYLYEIEYEGNFYVLKYFVKEEHTREIKNYSILRELDIPTIQVHGCTDKSLLLEDLNKSGNYRLGVEVDMDNMEVARLLAVWYKKLHSRGSEYVAKRDNSLYRETDDINRENIELVRGKSNTMDNPLWGLILDNLEFISKKIRSMGETLTYNDFYWTNLAVGRDGSTAIMFDYNFLGIGYRYADVRNVCSSLSAEAGRIFLEAYGEINEEEKVVDEFICHIINLISAYKRPIFPGWAKESLDAVSSGEVEKTFRRILK